MTQRKRFYFANTALFIIALLLAGTSGYGGDVDILEVPSQMKGMDNYHKSMRHLAEQMDGVLSDDDLQSTLSEARQQLKEAEYVLPPDRQMTSEDLALAGKTIDKLERFPYCISCASDVVLILNGEIIKVCSSIALAINSRHNPNQMAQIIADGRIIKLTQRLTGHMKQLAMMADVEHGRDYSGASATQMQDEIRSKANEER